MGRRVNQQIDAASIGVGAAQRQTENTPVCCAEEIAWRQGWIDSAQRKQIAIPLAKSGYGQYLLRIIDEQVF